MRYVLDSSVGFKWVVIEPDTVKARRLRDDYRNAVHDLLAPDVLPVEVAHALTRGERQGRVPVAQGHLLMRDFLNSLPRIFSSLALLPRAYEISSQARIGVYDCLYVALAEREQCQFITADDRLVRSLQGQFPFLVALSSLP
jgi:predicted nucleic acid-binding protein